MRGSLTFRIVRDCLWGDRGLVETMPLWLPLAFFVSRGVSAHGTDTAWTCLQILAAVALHTYAGILVNDLSDREADTVARKQRWIRLLPQTAGATVAAGLAGVGLLVVLAAGGSPAVLAAYAVSMIMAALYSLKPARFKERGLLGLINYSVSCTLLYLILPWAWLKVDGLSLLALAPAIFLDKWVNLHFHQVVDCDTDQKTGVRTYAVVRGIERARKSLRWAAGLASVSQLAVLASLPFMLPKVGPAISLAGVLVALTVGACIRFFPRHPRTPSLLTAELPAAYLGLTFALFRIVPIALFIRLALREPTLWPLALVLGLLVLIESAHSIRYRNDY